MPALTCLPSTIDALQFVRARTDEIALLREEVEAGRKRQASRRTFQTLPRAMRRRAASHSTKRLPIRLRQAALEEAARDPTATPRAAKKPPCRRRLRRPANIREVFAARQGASGEQRRWLATHLWHAKRAAMARRWGYQVALRANEKCRRASIRAASLGAFIHDASYLEVVRIEYFHRCSWLKLVTTTAAGGSDGGGGLFRCKETIEGVCAFFESSTKDIDHRSSVWETLLYHPGGGPLIGPVMVIGTALGWGSLFKGRRPTVHLFFHPLMRDEVAAAILATSANTAPCLLERGEYCVFDVEGNDFRSLIDEMLPPGRSRSRAASFATATRLVDPQLCGPVIAPFLPRAAPALHPYLWDLDGCKSALKARKSIHRANEARARCAVPGQAVEGEDLAAMGQGEPTMPVLVVGRATSVTSTATGSGRLHHRFRLIVPAGWGLSLWRAILGRGRVRFGGLEEAAAVAIEGRRPAFPADYPECAAFGVEADRICDEEEGQWLRRPPAKRLPISPRAWLAPIKEQLGRILQQRSPSTADCDADASCKGTAPDMIRCFVTMEAKGVPERYALVTGPGITFAFVTSGTYSQHLGRGIGIAFVCLARVRPPTDSPALQDGKGGNGDASTAQTISWPLAVSITNYGCTTARGATLTLLS